MHSKALSPCKKVCGLLRRELVPCKPAFFFTPLPSQHSLPSPMSACPLHGDTQKQCCAEAKRMSATAYVQLRSAAPTSDAPQHATELCTDRQAGTTALCQQCLGSMLQTVVDADAQARAVCCAGVCTSCPGVQYVHTEPSCLAEYRAIAATERLLFAAWQVMSVMGESCTRANMGTRLPAGR